MPVLSANISWSANALPVNKKFRLGLGGLMIAGAAMAAGIEVTLVDTNGKPVTDAVVYAEPLSGKVPKGNLTAVIEQVDKEFTPMVSAVQTGTAVSFPNRDSVRHQVYSFSPAKTFNIKLYSGTPAEPVVFDKPGVVTMGCNIHDWMLGYVYVVDTPWFARSDARGIAKLASVPNGDYTLKAWHPHLNGEAPALPMKVSGADGKASLTLPVSNKPLKPARRETGTASDY